MNEIQALGFSFFVIGVSILSIFLLFKYVKKIHKQVIGGKKMMSRSRKERRSYSIPYFNIPRMIVHLMGFAIAFCVATQIFQILKTGIDELETSNVLSNSASLILDKGPLFFAIIMVIPLFILLQPPVRRLFL